MRTEGMRRGVIGVGLGVFLVLSGCVTPQYVDWKILQAKVEKLNERLNTVEVLAVSTDARVGDLTAALQKMRKDLHETETILTQSLREEQEQEFVTIKQQLAALKEVVEESSRRIRDLVEVGVIRKIILQGTVFFDSGQTSLTQEAKAALDKLGAELVVQNFFTLEVSGYTDKEGSDAKNLALSRKRAETVAEYLIKNFSLDRHKVEIEGFGNAYPLAPRTTEEGKIKNRRVEVKAFSLSLP